MKKLLFTIFCITQIGFILVYPTEALKAAREGLNLWLNVMTVSYTHLTLPTT